MERIMNDVRRKLAEELESIAQKGMNANSVHLIYEIMDAIKDSYEIEEMSMGGNSHSYGGGWEARGMYGRGNSYADGVEPGRDMGGSYYRRDAMGRYSREGGSSYHGDSMEECLDRLMGDAKTKEQRDLLERFKREMMR